MGYLNSLLVDDIDINVLNKQCHRISHLENVRTLRVRIIINKVHREIKNRLVNDLTISHSGRRFHPEF